jgi:hypothetical protein
MAAVLYPLLKKRPFNAIIAAPEPSDVFYPQGGEGSRCLSLKSGSEVNDLLGI